MEKKSLKEVDKSGRNLIESSIKARALAYSKYSNFQVGAALLTKDGQVFLGCNVENVSFGLTICAERTAIVKAVSEGITEFEAVAVSAVNKGLLVSPCGACRQVLAEFNPRMKVYMYNPDVDLVGETSLGHLLPESLNPENLSTQAFQPKV